jgi:hypothetical protein
MTRSIRSSLSTVYYTAAALLVYYNHSFKMSRMYMIGMKVIVSKERGVFVNEGPGGGNNILRCGTATSVNHFQQSTGLKE